MVRLRDRMIRSADGWGPDVAKRVAALAMPEGDAASDLPCRARDAELWFSRRPQDLREAMRLCRHCPARNPCREVAARDAAAWGVWGGELFEDGHPIPVPRPRGRPRKAG